MHHMNYLRLLQLRRGGMLAPDTGSGSGAGSAGGGSDESGTAGKETENGGDGDEGKGNEGGEKTFTQDEVNRILKRELEKREKSYQKKIDDARTEAERLARMSEQERAEHERAQREADYENRIKELERRELSTQVREMLIEKGLNPEFTQLIPMENAETAKAAIDNLHKAFNKAVEKKVQEEVEKRLKQGAGAPSAGNGGKPMTMRDAIAAKLGKN